MNIRINKATDPFAWYAKHVGTVLPVERVEINRHPFQGIPEDVYWCREGGTYNPINYVRKSDATELPPMIALSPREIDVLRLVARGFPNKQIAGQLSISVKTVEKHRQAVMDKSGRHHTAGLTMLAIKLGVVEVA